MAIYWLGTDDAGFYHWDRHKNTFKSYKPQRTSSSPTYHNIHALLQDGDKLYIGMYMGGLDIMNLNTGKFKNYQVGNSAWSLYASGIYTLYKDSHQQIWIGTTSGLNKYIPETDDFERIYEVHPADISYIMEDKKGHLWVCSLNKGIFQLDRQKQKWEHFYWKMGENEAAAIPTNKNHHSMYRRERKICGWELMGADYSNTMIKSNTFVKVALPENIRVIYKIIAAKNELWLTTSNGMYCYQPTNGNIKTYNKYDGLQENQFLPNSGIQLSDGTILPAESTGSMNSIRKNDA